MGTNSNFVRPMLPTYRVCTVLPKKIEKTRVGNTTYN